MAGLGMLRRLLVRLHPGTCEDCRWYARQLATLAEASRRLRTVEDPGLARLEESILRAMMPETDPAFADKGPPRPA